MAYFLRRKQHLIDSLESNLSLPVAGLDDEYRLLDSLGVQLNTAVLFSEDQPQAALDVLWHFLDRLPVAFAKVQDQAAMKALCTFLAEDMVRVAVRGQTRLAETAHRLRRAEATHRHTGNPFQAVGAILANPRLPGWARAVIDQREAAVS